MSALRLQVPCLVCMCICGVCKRRGDRLGRMYGLMDCPRRRRRRRRRRPSYELCPAGELQSTRGVALHTQRKKRRRGGGGKIKLFSFLERGQVSSSSLWSVPSLMQAFGCRQINVGLAGFWIVNTHFVVTGNFPVLFRRDSRKTNNKDFRR